MTGAASGIGRACAELFAREGARLALLDLQSRSFHEVSLATDAVAIPVDLFDAEATEAAVVRAGGALGGLDSVINCAGVTAQNRLEDVSLTEWSRVLAINLTAPFVICRAALPWLLLAEEGSIVNIASAAALLPTGPGSSAYISSKGGLIALTKALAAELAPKVRANVVCPGLTRTPMTNGMFEGYSHRPSDAAAVSHYAMRRAAHPDEIAWACLFLASREASYVTGATLAVDGGRTFY